MDVEVFTFKFRCTY